MSITPVLVQLGASAEHGCEAVGFPQSEVQRTPDGSPVTTVRQSEHVVGTLLPAGQAKVPANPDRPLPHRWIPFDSEGSRPDEQGGWGGMSGAGVVLPDGRLVGLIVAAEARHQQRRLYVVTFADVLARSAVIAEAVSAALGYRPVIEARSAPIYRRVLQEACLGPDGLPMLVGHASFGAFGVKPAGIPGESAFLEYVPRDGDQKLRDGLLEARAEHKMLLVVGGSAAGKSRSAAEAARVLLSGCRLLCPKQTSLAKVLQLPLADLGPALVWLDDAERYEERAFRDTVRELLHSGVAVAATIRRTEREARMPHGDVRNTLGEALTDHELVLEVGWPVIWNDQERERVGDHVRYPALLEWVAAGQSPSAWVVAGPALQDRLRDAQADDERPARYALVRSVLDWYRTGVTRPIPLDTAISLLRASLPDEVEPEESEDCVQWALGSVTGAGRKTSQSLLARTSAGDTVTVHDYIRDADARALEGVVGYHDLEAIGRIVAEPVWMAALDDASDDERLAIANAAMGQFLPGIAVEAWRALAAKGDTDAMYYIGLVKVHSDVAAGEEWWRRAAKMGHTEAMYHLASLVDDWSETDGWMARAAQAGHKQAMWRLARILEDSYPGQARQWYERAAQAGQTDAMNRLAELLEDSDPAKAWECWQQAAEDGNTDAMYNIGIRLLQSDPEGARHWIDRAATKGNVDAMYFVAQAESDNSAIWEWLHQGGLGVGSDVVQYLAAMVTGSDPSLARALLETVASMYPDAMYSLGELLTDSDPDAAIPWLERAAQAGLTHAMNRLGELLEDRDAARAWEWWRRAAQDGNSDAMWNMGIRLLRTDPEGRRWIDRAAVAGNVHAIYFVARPGAGSSPIWQWLQQGATGFHIGAMNNLAATLTDSEPSLAQALWQKAAEMGDSDAMRSLASLLTNSDPEAARSWLDQAEQAEETGA